MTFWRPSNPLRLSSLIEYETMTLCLLFCWTFWNSPFSSFCKLWSTKVTLLRDFTVSITNSSWLVIMGFKSSPLVTAFQSEQGLSRTFCANRNPVIAAQVTTLRCLCSRGCLPRKATSLPPLAWQFTSHVFFSPFTFKSRWLYISWVRTLHFPLPDMEDELILNICYTTQYL